MKDKEKKIVLKHIAADDKEFRKQISEDKKLKKTLVKKTGQNASHITRKCK